MKRFIIGLRLGDCSMLECGQVDLVRGFISLIPRKTARKNGRSVQSIVGHATAEMTRHYYHESQGALVAAVTALPDVVRPGTGPSSPDAVTPRVKALCAALDALDAQQTVQYPLVPVNKQSHRDRFLL